MSNRLVLSLSEKKYSFSRDRYGFLKQDNPDIFNYDLDYKKKQSTNTAMNWLRTGWLFSSISPKDIQSFNAVDIGSGNNSFVHGFSSMFSKLAPYDVCGESIDDLELYGTHWDIVFLFDVLEHYKDIDSFWGLDFEYAMISFPETPDPKKYDLSRWRHFKPNEHLYMLDSVNFKSWVESHGCQVVAYGNPEDAIRKPWDSKYINISTFLIRRI